MEAMALRSGKALSGLPPALAAQAEQIRVCARDGEAAQLAALLDACAAAHGPEACALALGGVDWGGWTALHYAASSNRAEAVQLLLARGGSALACDGDGWSPLHVACLNGAAGAAAQLLAHAPAAAALRTQDGDAAIDLAHEMPELVALLTARGVPQPAARPLPAGDGDDGGGGGSIDAACSAFYYEGNDDEVAAEDAAGLVAAGTIQDETLVYSDQEAFPFEGWTAWSDARHLFGIGAGDGDDDDESGDEMAVDSD
jgi:hypothetical protein